MKYSLALALILGWGCTQHAMAPGYTIRELNRLPGNSDPVRATCRDHSGRAPSLLPVQLRSEAGPRAVEAAFVDCMDVLTVLISVAMEGGDRTEDGLKAVRDRLAERDSQSLADTCDEHYPAWRALWVREVVGPLVARGTYDETPTRYDFWMYRCRRVLRPFSKAAS